MSKLKFDLCEHEFKDVSGLSVGNDKGATVWKLQECTKCGISRSVTKKIVYEESGEGWEVVKRDDRE